MPSINIENVLIAIQKKYGGSGQIWIFSYYFDIDYDEIVTMIENKVTITSPVRDIDEHPSFGFYISEDGTIRGNDFAGYFHGDCIDAAMITTNSPDVRSTLRRIILDFKVYKGAVGYFENYQNRTNLRKARSSTKLEYNIYFREWTITDKMYWGMYKLPIDFIHSHNVRPVQQVELNNKINYVYRVSDPCYYYEFPNNLWQLYFPYRTKEFTKFILNGSPIMGLKAALSYTGSKEYLVKAKAYKDVLCYLYNDIPAYCTSSEGVPTPYDLILELTNRFPRTFANNDYDKTGIRYYVKHYYELYKKKGWFKPLFFVDIPNVKDFADLVRYYNVPKLLRIIDYDYDITEFEFKEILSTL